ncbi:SDR family NAD(P)-dependent oxidoreductase [Methylobacterium sp. 17Sr1-1]|uniref:SDR family NAD(P)-dependent oxidoreductase n=1 Tax=Methylobacterium sp. 17Sr1-1 TaxID=2202826 RepID=UPI000D7010EE|nr:SDR family NAD(P)-dependent oxidoreductase [Methylobacterium sp. 17Sr1-1]AWN52880.1 oxidoreductase [Methylobacterium sp. 17Sr1-1]
MSDTPLPETPVSGKPFSGKPLADRIAVVTGASRGIGRAASLALAEAGAHVIAVARTQGALEDLDDAVRAAGGSATLVPLDLCDYDAIDRLGAAIHERWGRLDVLVGNAGVLGKLMPLGHVDPKVWSSVMDVNVTANWRLIRSLDPLLRRSDAGRAVFVTSGAASSCRAYWGPYAVSKAALEALVRTYAAETASTPVRAMLLNPGPLRTAMRKAAMPGEDPETLRTPEDLAPHIVRLASPASTESGMIFDFPTGRVLTPQKPA